MTKHSINFIPGDAQRPNYSEKHLSFAKLAIECGDIELLMTHVVAGKLDQSNDALYELILQILGKENELFYDLAYLWLEKEFNIEKLNNNPGVQITIGGIEEEDITPEGRVGWYYNAIHLYAIFNSPNFRLFKLAEEKFYELLPDEQLDLYLPKIPHNVRFDDAIKRLVHENNKADPIEFLEYFRKKGILNKEIIDFVLSRAMKAENEEVVSYLLGLKKEPQND